MTTLKLREHTVKIGMRI
ncbi:unnamed protein product [Acanthoscelides obtectus]|uniref:Uncharacterized protein n=1 Tax=Acanthoscelides obtectus TaxID=200917 RepID=A0A9P0Q255_ACAOB|nr:unnamed protein product [Acanthoscelides obtectus]CAK1677411.1 hypothetical protein AOBTE_LOCUS31302 [Acanthoscelides obtectus]